MKTDLDRRISGEVRAADDGSHVITGYASVFNQETQLWEGFTEMVAPGAFDASLARDDVRALWAHDSSKPLGRTGNGTLQVMPDDHGLRFSLQLPDNTWGNDAWSAIQRGDVDKMSFGFVVDADVVIRGEDQITRRVLTAVTLYEISPVTWPAYEGTQVSARSKEMIDKAGEVPADQTNTIPDDWLEAAEARGRLIRIMEGTV